MHILTEKIDKKIIPEILGERVDRTETKEHIIKEIESRFDTKDLNFVEIVGYAHTTKYDRFDCNSQPNTKVFDSTGTLKTNVSKVATVEAFN